MYVRLSLWTSAAATVAEVQIAMVTPWFRVSLQQREVANEFAVYGSGWVMRCLCLCGGAQREKQDYHGVLTGERWRLCGRRALRRVGILAGPGRTVRMALRARLQVGPGPNVIEWIQGVGRNQSGGVVCVWHSVRVTDLSRVRPLEATVFCTRAWALGR